MSTQHNGKDTSLNDNPYTYHTATLTDVKFDASVALRYR